MGEAGDDRGMTDQNTTETTVTPDPGAPNTSSISSDERLWAMLSHILAILFYFWAPLIIWLVKKGDSPFVADQAKESLNFQITVFLVSIVCALLIFVIVGCFLLPAVAVANLVLCIMAGLAANKGEAYRYPFAIRLIK